MLESLCDVFVSDGASLSEGQSSSVWNSAYPPQASSCLPPVPVHPDFTSSPVSFNHPDGALWADHVLSQGSLPPPATLPDSWTYSLNPQNSSGYPNVYHPHPHIHTRHHHPMLHSYSTHSPAALDPRFNPLLLPSVRSQNQPTASTASSPHSEGVKTEMDPSSNSTLTATSVTWTPSALHGSLEAYDSGRCCKRNSTQYTQAFVKPHMHSNLAHNSNFTFFLSLPQLLSIRPKQRRQFGSNWCTGDEGGISIHTKKETYFVALSMYGCNTSTVMYNADRRLTVAQTMSSTLSTPLIMDMNLGFGHKWQRSNAAAPGQHPWRKTTSFTDGWMGGLFLSVGFFMQRETKWFCFKSFILIHILFCTVQVCLRL